MGNSISPDFTPVASTVGGLLIGLSTVAILHGAGEIMGFTGVISGACFGDLPHRSLFKPENGWRFSFLASFFISTLLVLRHTRLISAGYFDATTVIPWWMVAISGALAGIGTKMANGCTSGHGICGLGRLSPRSFVAVATFMSTAFLSATLCSPVFPRIESITRLSEPKPQEESAVIVGIGIAFASMFCIATFASIWFQMRLAWVPSSKDAAKSMDGGDEEQAAGGEQRGSPADALQKCPVDYNATSVDGVVTKEQAISESDNWLFLLKILVAVIVAPIFSIGLIVGGMTKQSKLVGFFDLTGFARGIYDPSLMLLFVAGVMVSFIGYQFVADPSVRKVESIINKSDRIIGRKSALAGEFHIPSNKVIDRRLVVGSAIFGVSMGISGFCPSPSMIMLLGGYFDAAAIWLPLYGVSSILCQLYLNQMGKDCERCAGLAATYNSSSAIEPECRHNQQGIAIPVV